MFFCCKLWAFVMPLETVVAVICLGAATLARCKSLSVSSFVVAKLYTAVHGFRVFAILETRVDQELAKQLPFRFTVARQQDRMLTRTPNRSRCRFCIRASLAARVHPWY